MKPKALVLQAYGSNRDFDVMDALTLADADPIGMPLNELRSRKTLFRDFQLLVLPGGFSYADALGAGKLLALDLASYFADEITEFVESGKPVIGICNGFQALVKAGILPGNNVIARGDGRVGGLAPSLLKHLPPYRDQAPKQSPDTWNISEQQEISLPMVARNDICTATLTFNQRGHFECRWVIIKPISQTCIWTKDLNEIIACPIAHGEGNFQTDSSFPLSSFIAGDQIALTYVRADGSPANGDYPANPNGSVLDIAGICNPRGNVLGLMPHPENHIFDYQHPRHTRGETGNSGLSLFQNGVEYASKFC